MKVSGVFWEGGLSSVQCPPLDPHKYKVSGVCGLGGRGVQCPPPGRKPPILLRSSVHWGSLSRQHPPTTNVNHTPAAEIPSHDWFLDYWESHQFSSFTIRSNQRWNQKKPLSFLSFFYIGLSLIKLSSLQCALGMVSCMHQWRFTDFTPEQKWAIEFLVSF